METAHHHVAFTRCLNGLNDRLSEQWLIGSIMDFWKFTLSPVDSVKVLMTDFREKKTLPGITVKDNQCVISILNDWEVIV